MKLSLAVLLGMLAVASFPRLSWSATAEEVISELMCPCPDNCGQQLTTCQCGHADGYRDEVRQRLSRGESKEQILGWFVQTYGEKALTVPAATGFGMVAWALPPLALIGGIVLLRRKILRLRGGGDGKAVRSAASSTASQTAESVADRTYMDRVEDELKE